MIARSPPRRYCLVHRTAPLCLLAPGAADAATKKGTTGAPPTELVELGRDLFDPSLCGNRSVAFGICHSAARGTGDGLALDIGEGGAGTGPERCSGAEGDEVRRFEHDVGGAVGVRGS